jgi:hypothetical protein
MKRALTIPVLAAMLATTLATTACTNLYSTDPLVADSDAITIPGLAGVWAKDGDTIFIREKGNAYAITYRDNKNSMAFSARVVRSGHELLLDVVRDTEEPFLLPLHFAVRAQVDGATLRWSLVDREHKDSEQTLLSPEELRKAASADAGREHKEVWTRVNE